MVHQVTNNLLDEYHPSNRSSQPSSSQPSTSNEPNSGYNQPVSLIGYENASSQQPVDLAAASGSGPSASYSVASCSSSYYYPTYANASYQGSSSFSSAPYPNASYAAGTSYANSSGGYQQNNASYYYPAASGDQYQSSSQYPASSQYQASSQYPASSQYQANAQYPASNQYQANNQYQGDQYHNSQLIRRNSFNNYDQSTDSEQYLINSYYELADHLEPAAPHANYGNLPEQDQQFIENYHHLNYSSSQIANNPNYIGYESYTAEYLTARDNALNFNSMIIFDSSLFKRFRERLKHACSKNLPCLLIVLMPIFFATILILFFVRIYKSDKTDKDDLHQYAIYAFIIFSILFISPFALFFSIVVINKIVKRWNKTFNPNFIGNEFGDLISANAVDPAALLSAAAAAHPLNTQTAASYQHLSNANLTVNLANANQTHDLHPSPLNGGQIADLQGGLPNALALGNSLALGSNLALGGALVNGLPDSQQISTLNVNQLQYNSANNRQLINEMIEEFDQMNPADQERTLQRMSSIQRRQRLIRQNAFESADPQQQQPSLTDLICYEDKPPSYELALLCPKKRDCESDKTKKETDKKSASKLHSDCGLSLNYVNLSESTTVRRDDREQGDVVTSSLAVNAVNTAVNSGVISSTANTTAVNSTNHPGEPESNSTLQTELRNNLENRRRSSNGSSINTEPPTYSSLYTLDPQAKEEDAK